MSQNKQSRNWVQNVLKQYPSAPLYTETSGISTSMYTIPPNKIHASRKSSGRSESSESREPSASQMEPPSLTIPEYEKDDDTTDSNGEIVNPSQWYLDMKKRLAPFKTHKELTQSSTTSEQSSDVPSPSEPSISSEPSTSAEESTELNNSLSVSRNNVLNEEIRRELREAKQPVIPVKMSMCQANILDVSGEIYVSNKPGSLYHTFSFIDQELIKTGIFKVRVNDEELRKTGIFKVRENDKIYDLMTLLFCFREQDKKEIERYTHADIYFNRGSYDPRASTHAIEQNRQGFTRQQKANKTPASEIKSLGNQYNGMRNSILIRLLFLFLIKVMFYAEYDIYFTELVQDSLSKHIILCGNNIILGRGGVFYPNNIFLRNNVRVSNLYEHMDKYAYLHNVKTRFIEFLQSINVFEKKGEHTFTLDAIYNFLQKKPMGRDKKIKEYLRQYEKLSKKYK
jgi:hypothetical protein